MEGRFQWPRGLKCVFAAARLLGLRVRIPPGAWRSALIECYLLSGTDPCDGPSTRPEESYWVWCDWEKSQDLDKNYT